jgi:hypothetical protein
MVPKPLLQCYGIIIKNLSNHWTNKKRFFGEFIFPIIISSLYIVMQCTYLIIPRIKISKPICRYYFRGSIKNVNCTYRNVSHKITCQSLFELKIKTISTISNYIWFRIKVSYIKQFILYGTIHVFFSSTILFDSQLLSF